MADTDLIARQLLSDLKRDFGLSDEQAAGVVGNLMHESGGFQTLQEVNPTVPGSAGGFGFAQWTGERRKDFDRYVEDAGLDRSSYEANYGFLKHELENNRYERNQFNKVKKADTAAEAARIVSENYLRPGTPNNSSRVRYAEQVLPFASMPVPPADIPNTVGTALSTVPTPPRTVMPPMPSAPSRGMQMQRDQNAALADRLAAAEPDPAPNNLTAPGAIDAMFASLPKLPTSLPSVPGASDRVRGNEQQTRNTATTIASYPTTAPPSVSDMMRGRNAYQTIASVPSVSQPMPSASDRVRGSNGYQTIATILSTPVGQPPATRMVQSVPMPAQNPQVSASDMARGRNGYQTIASIPSRPQSYAGQEAAPPPSQQFTRAAGFAGGAATPYAGMVPPITSLPPLPSLEGFDVANKDQSRLVAGQYPMAPGGEIPTAASPFGQMPPMPLARPIRQPSFAAMPPMPRARPVFAQRPQPMPAANNRSPLRIVVNGGGRAPVPQLTPVQRYQAQGMSSAQAYDAANQSSADRARQNSGRSGQRELVETPDGMQWR